MQSLSRALLLVVSGALFSTFLSLAHAQERLCPGMMPSSAALLSDGTLGVGFGYDNNGNAQSGFASIRSVQDYNGCYNQEARKLMEDMCVAFLTKVRVGVGPGVTTSCELEQEALESMARENALLKRTIKRLKARLARK